MPDDVRISELPEATALTGDDLLVLVNSPGAGAETQEIKASNAKPFFVDGVTADLAAHAAAADPHAQYLTAAEGAALAVGGDLTGTVGNAQIAANAVGAAEIAAGAVGLSELAGDAKPAVNVKDPAYGAVGNHRTVADGVISAGLLSTLTSATAAFTSGDVGKAVTVAGAGPTVLGSDTPLSTTIAGYTNATTVTLTAAAARAVTAKRVDLGTDDSAAFQAAITAALATGGPKTVYVPPGSYMVPATLTISGSVRFRGAAQGTSTVVHSSASHGLTITAPNGSTVDLEDLTLQGPAGLTFDNGTYGVNFSVNSGFSTRFAVRRVAVLGTWDHAILRSGGGYYELVDSHLEGTDAATTCYDSSDTANSMFFVARGTTFTTPNGDLSSTGSVGVYIHPHVAFLIEGCRFTTLGRYGVYQNGTSASARRPSVIAGCEFVDCAMVQTAQNNNGKTFVTGCTSKGNLNGLSSSLNADDDSFDNCLFDTCGTLNTHKSCRVSDCTFIDSGIVAESAATRLHIADCFFRITDAAPTVGMCVQVNGTAAKELRLDNCEFVDTTTTGTTGAAVNVVGTTTDTRVTKCRFVGIRATTTAGMLRSRGTRLLLDGCEFDNTAQGTTRAVTATLNADMLEGTGNVFRGTTNLNTLDGTNQQRLVRRPGVNPASVASAATIDTNTTAWLNYDTHVVTGTAAIATLSNPWVAAGPVRLIVAAGASWSTASTGNITPLSTAARAAGQVVTLLWEPTVGKWLETGAAGGGGDPAMGGDLTGTASNAQLGAGVIVNADINAAAAIALSKLATDPLARGNHTGTQTAATISDFATAVAGTAVGGDVSGTVGNAQIAASAVGTAELADGAVTAAKVAADVATQAELDAASTADRARANHTGTQLASTISDLGSTAILKMPLVSGHYYTQWGLADSTVATTLNRLAAGLFYVPAATTFDQIGCTVTTAGAAGAVVRMGIWAVGSNGKPDTLILDAGTVDTTTTGAKTITISQALNPGWYYVGAVSQGATCTLRSRTGPCVLLPEVAVGSAGNVGWVQNSVSGALPNPYVTTTLTATEQIKVQLRAA